MGSQEYQAREVRPDFLATLHQYLSPKKEDAESVPQGPEDRVDDQDHKVDRATKDLLGHPVDPAPLVARDH